MKRIIFFSCIIFISINQLFAQKEDISCKQAFELIQKNWNNSDFVILDLRPVEMFNEGHLENSVYYDVFSEGFEKWVTGLNKDKMYLLYCTAGYRSGIALKTMKKSGFKNLYHLYEGIREWEKQGFKVVKN